MSNLNCFHFNQIRSFQILTIDLGDGGLVLNLAPGLYRYQFQFQAEPSQDQPFVAGGYQVIAAVCEGSCGSTHSHSFTLAERETGFQITSN
jgi:hypothetical protein